MNSLYEIESSAHAVVVPGYLGAGCTKGERSAAFTLGFPGLDAERGAGGVPSSEFRVPCAIPMYMYIHNSYSLFLP